MKCLRQMKTSCVLYCEDKKLLQIHETLAVSWKKLHGESYEVKKKIPVCTLFVFTPKLFSDNLVIQPDSWRRGGQCTQKAFNSCRPLYALHAYVTG